MAETTSKKKPTSHRKKKKIIVEIRQPKSLFSNVFFYFFLIAGMFLLFGFFQGYDPNAKTVSLNEVISNLKDEKVQDITVSGDTIEVLLQDGTKLVSSKETNVSFDEVLNNNNVDISKIAGEYKVEHNFSLEEILPTLVTIAIPVFILFLLVKQMKGASGDIMSFGKARAKMFNKNESKITFADVAGNEEAKREMYEIVDFLKNPEKYRKLGARIPKGVLLIGASGVGKTLLARAIAGEANVPFFSVAGSEFMEMLVGVGSARARDLFKRAKETQPSLIFIDEIDAIGRQRGMGIGGGHDEREQTLNQILIEMDGFDTRTNVIVLAATNRPDMLDPALVRPGRFDRRINIPLPDLNDRVEILKIHMKGKPFEDNFSIHEVAKKTVGFSGADLENMLNEAAILAARVGNTKISQKDVDDASLKVTVGSERKTMQTDEERKLTAYHEAGHALVAAFSKDMDAVHRVSIVARGVTLGHTEFPPERDRYNETKTRLMSIIATSLGGRAAEEVIFNEFTTGASNDIENATKLAKKMVTQFGMSNLGPVNYESDDSDIWLAKEFSNSPAFSQEMAAKIDVEVKNIMDSQYQKAKEIIISNREKLDRISGALLEKETLYGDEFRALIS